MKNFDEMPFGQIEPTKSASLAAMPRYSNRVYTRTAPQGGIVVRNKESYPALIREAFWNAHNGDMFAPFRPPVLEALAAEYRKGSVHWLAFSEWFKFANYRVPLNDLDRAMRAMHSTVEVNESGYYETEENYSVLIGAALAAAEAGDDFAPFERRVLEALISLWMRDEDHPRFVGRSFERANKKIRWSKLKRTIERTVFMLLGTPQAVGLTMLADYIWDRPAGDALKSSVH